MKIKTLMPKPEATAQKKEKLPSTPLEVEEWIVEYVQARGGSVVFNGIYYASMGRLGVTLAPAKLAGLLTKLIKEGQLEIAKDGKGFSAV